MKPNILVVDDEPSARDALARTLSSHGYPVRTANDSEETMRHLATEPADIILLDLNLPHVPGDSLAAFLRIRHPKTRIIFMSGEYDMIDPERFGEGTQYFRKPLDLEALLEALETEKGAEGLASRA